jgi:hypothetical protein
VGGSRQCSCSPSPDGLPLPGGGSAPARAGRADPRPGRRGPPRHADDPRGDPWWPAAGRARTARGRWPSGCRPRRCGPWPPALTGENFRRGGYLPYEQRYERAVDFIQAARTMWESGRGVAGLHHHGVDLRAARHPEAALQIEELAAVDEARTPSPARTSAAAATSRTSSATSAPSTSSRRPALAVRVPATPMWSVAPSTAESIVSVSGRPTTSRSWIPWITSRAGARRGTS